MHEKKILTLSDFDYDFPEDLIAQTPAPERDGSRLLVRQSNGAISHHRFADLPGLLPQNSLLIVNDTSVMQSRLHGFLKTGARIEIFLLEPVPSEGGAVTWRALAKPLKKLRAGSEILLPADESGAHNPAPVIGRILAIEESALTGEVPAARISFTGTTGHTNFNFSSWLDRVGETPLPPYIHRKASGKNADAPKDRQRYETVYARMKGSVAAPTAGLHFTAELLDRLRKAGHEVAPVTLHVGGGTFLPVRQEDISLHQMHDEKFQIPLATVEAVLSAKAAGRPVVCVGTTSFRCLESFFKVAQTANPRELAGAWHSTRLFIYPAQASERYRPAMIDALITNFHQPKSTLFMLVSALIGVAEARTLYRAAIDARYRLFSYGDSSLLKL